MKELPDQEIVAPGAKNKADGATAKREQQPFTKQLPNDLPARCTDGESDGDLLRTRRAAREQHIGQIQTGDEQDCSGHRHEQRRDQSNGTVVVRLRAQTKARRPLNL